MTFEPEFYQILGIKSNATENEIKSAFKKKAMELHPDKNRNDPRATEKFQQINEAYETLKDPAKKKEYDLKHQPKKASTSTNIDDLLRNLFGFRSSPTFNTRKSQYSHRNFFYNDDDDIFDYFNDFNDFNDFDDSDDSDDLDDFDDDDYIFYRRHRGGPLDTIFIGGLPSCTTAKDLLAAFASYNPCRVKVISKSPPFGFVQFNSPQEMQKAARERSHVLINGKVCHAKPSHTNLY